MSVLLVDKKSGSHICVILLIYNSITDIDIVDVKKLHASILNLGT